MKLKPFGFSGGKKTLKGEVIDEWLRSIAQQGEIEIYTRNGRDCVDLITVRLVCPFEQYDFLEYSYIPNVKLTAVLKHTKAKSITLQKALEKASYFVLTVRDVQSDPIYLFEQARESLIHAAFELKPYWLTAKLITYAINDCCYDEDGQRTEYVKRIEKLRDYPSLSEKPYDHYDVPFDQLKTEEDKKKHYLGYYRTLFLDGYEDEETQDVDVVCANCKNDEEAERLFNLLRPESDRLLDEEITKLQNVFLGEARMSATEEEMNAWLQKVEKYIPQDRYKVYDEFYLVSVEDLMIKQGVFTPSRITAEGNVEFDGKMRVLTQEDFLKEKTIN